MRALVAVDGSKEASMAMVAASRLLSSADREIDILYVEPELPALSGRLPVAAQSRVAGETRRILHTAKRTLAEAGVDALTRSRSGSPPSVILEESADYDITVIGARGLNVRSDVGLGPVASRVVEHATGCVLIGRELRDEKSVRILVPVDGSDSSRQAVDALGNQFDLGSAEITLLHVIETVWLRAGLEEELSGNLDRESLEADSEAQLLLLLKREAEQVLAEARTHITPQHPAVTSSIREGSPANEILSEADQGDYDLVVVGAGGAPDLKHRMLGSVSSKVAWNAPCSVLVVRTPE